MKTTFKLFLMIAVLGSISFFSSCNKDDDGPIYMKTVIPAQLNAKGKAEKAKADSIAKENSKYNDGTFILNEGNMTSENGFLSFISPKGEISDSIYYKTNNKPLGNVTQDMYINNSKAYFISQNGGRMGGDMIVIANAGNMKKIATFNDKVKDILSWPTHIAVTDDNHVYIRDNKGIYLFNPTTASLKFIDGTNGAAKKRMLIKNGKLFFANGNNLCVVKGDKKIHEINMPGRVTGIVKSGDSNLFITCASTPGEIIKLNPDDYSKIKTNTIAGATFSSGFSNYATPLISAKGDTIYFSDASTHIKRHIFSTGETKELADVKKYIENAGIVYNSLGVDPITGLVYFNTIKGFGKAFKINDITVFDFSNSTPKLVYDFKNHTHFPAGIFFTESFRDK